MTAINDVRSNLVAPPEAPVSRRLGAYQNFITEQRNTVYRNVGAYVNKRTATNRFPDLKLHKVIRGATFIPAHPTRFSPGMFQVEGMKYFVIHRPGAFPKACTLLNVIREFSMENRVASTHFVIGFNGELVQMVDLADQANHCGPSSPAKNFNSVGVEMEGAVGERFTLMQYRTLAKLIRLLHDLTNFLPNTNSTTFVQDCKQFLLGHSEIWPQKKTDPGYNFNYYLLASMIQETPPVSSGDVFRSPVDPLYQMEISLQEIVTQARDPSSAGSMALLSATTQDALAMQRAQFLALGGRTDMAYAAATAAQRQTAFMDRKLADIYQRIEMQGLTWAAVPNPETDFDSYLDYSGGIGTFVGDDDAL